MPNGTGRQHPTAFELVVAGCIEVVADDPERLAGMREALVRIGSDLGDDADAAAVAAIRRAIGTIDRRAGRIPFGPAEG